MADTVDQDKPSCDNALTSTEEKLEEQRIRGAKLARGLLLPIGHFLFKYRDALFPVVFITLAVCAKPRMLFGNERLDMVLDAVGFLVALSGQVLRALVISLAYIKRGGRNRRIAAGSLVQNGVFAHSRNPLYTGNMLFLIGFCLIHNSMWMYLVGLPFFLFAYYTIVFAEEVYLSEKFGATYGEYCKHVNRFIPSFSGWGETLRSMAFDWKRLIRKEYGTTFTWLTAVLGLLAWEGVANFGYGACTARVAILAALWLLVLAGYFVVRFFKKFAFLDSN